MTFFNIFSDKKKEKVKLKIIVDKREKNSLVPAELMNLGFELSWETLEVGDYLIGENIIERKTFSDLESSIINKRIFAQLENMKGKNTFLLIEGPTKNRTLHPNALKGFFLSVNLDYKIPTIFSIDEKDTAKYLLVLSKRDPNKEIGIRPSKKAETKEERIKFILEGFPGVGPKTAEELIKKFGNIKNIINATKDELDEILGKKKSDFLSLLD